LWLSWFQHSFSLELCLTVSARARSLEDALTVTVRIAGKWLYRMRRVLATMCIALLAVGVGFKVVHGANGMRVWQSKRAEVDALEREIESAKAEHEKLERHVQALQRGDPSIIEKEAREQLGYVKPGEVVLFESRAKSTPSPTPSVAQTSDPKP
jgi:cell division protein FtsB